VTDTQQTNVPAGKMAAKPRRTTAHTAAQLQQALGWSEGQFGRAVAAGILPEQDMKTPRWSGGVVDDLVARSAELAAAIPDDLDDSQLMKALELDYGDWRRAREAGLIPDPARPPYWTRAQADELACRAEQLRGSIPPQPLGARRCAELLSELTGMDVDQADIAELEKRGLTSVVDDYKGWDLYDVGALRAIPGDGEHLAVLTGIVTDRLAWLADSLTPREAAGFLGWHERDLARVATERNMATGRFGRYARLDIAALAGDEELTEQVRRDQLLGPEQAAQHAEMRRRDFDYCVAAGWIRPTTYVEREVGRRKTVDVPLYRIGDVEDMLTICGVDWEAVRAVRAGEVSPLREHTRLPISRAQAIRGFCSRLSADYSVEVWPHWWNAGDRWEIDWELREDGHPTKAEVAAALADHRGARQYADRITLSTAVGQVIRWARECLQPGVAVVLDTETTGLDGVIVEIAVIDACTGQTLLDTLVNPAGVPIEPGARAVHGITDAELANAPTWDQIVPGFLAAVGDRRILAYNAPFDAGAVLATHSNAGLEVRDLPAPDRWGCLMQARTTWARIGYWLPLGGRHRALGDAQDARRVVRAIGAPPGRPADDERGRGR
jgi:hypothetical protein